MFVSSKVWRLLRPMNSLEIETYVKQHLSTKLLLVSQGGFAKACPALKACEKALIYYYTCEEAGYDQLNYDLHTSNGNNHTELGKGLVVALNKLPPYERLVYSGVHLTTEQLTEYAVGSTVNWPAFLSTSTVRKVGIAFLQGGSAARPKNAFFLIKSLTGRRIGELSYFGPNGPGHEENESEVLFMPNTKFVVRKRTDTNTRTGVIEFELDEV